MREYNVESEQLNKDTDVDLSATGEEVKSVKKSADEAGARSMKRLKLNAAFWNKFDWVNKFRHWYIGVKSFGSGIFRVLAAWQTILILTILLILFYIFTAFYTGKGEFVIQVDRPMAAEGFLLSEDGDFSEWLNILRNDAVEDADNINITDIPDNVSMVNGNHNGRDYVAYTFYLKNKSSRVRDYQYTINIKNKYKGADKATWLMVYQNGKQVIYAAPNKDGHEECQYSRWAFPFVEDALDPEYQQSTITNENPGYITQEVIDWHEFDDLDGIYQLRTVPFVSENVVCKVVRKKSQPEEVDKYTVVIWLEGEDPECVNDIFGGYVEFNMKFSLVD